MVKMNGRLGKSKGSPTGGEKFEQEFYMTASEAAAAFRGLADEIEARGRVEASSGDWTLGVNLAEPIKIEVQYKHDPARRELEVQLKLKENP
ncbi:amphi-Trp domain-containing protein [Methanotrichaceae archaeon M04Ac]|jgi:amphi-Trp domain-containing protein|uniref:Amphi-Trp domain-containing protein n=1 Tax=Candidatus Methanocrinis alkalitolerans TaxID=3033395 RepID=A0ABT5XHC4_9EURY|nr:amphi-Trp domain-containing protein [Candidatus Methanocrinis alkalitolerans]MDF0594127.1 amphi-Trp domain-containing protein [Candidatus Methanocrinis alkalitolerans]